MLDQSTQFQLQLPQRLDNLRLKQRCRGRIAFHLSISQTPELFDHFIEAAGAQARRSPFAAEVLRFAKAFANLCGKLPVVAPVATNHSGAIETAALPVALRLAAVLCAAGLLIALLLTALRSLLALLTLLPLPLLASLALLTLLTLLALLLTLLITLLLLTVAIASRIFIQTTPQRIKVVSQLPRPIEILFRGRTIRGPRALLRSLQTFRKVVETTLDRTFIGAASALLIALLTSLLSTLLTTVERLFAFANSLGDAITRQRISRFLQLARRPLLRLALTGTHRACRLFEVLLQTLYRIRQRVFSFPQLLASFARVLVLCALPTTTRKVLHVLRDLALPRRSLRSTLAQVTYLLLASRRT